MTNPNTRERDATDLELEMRKCAAGWHATPALANTVAEWADRLQALATPQPAPVVRMSGYMAKQWLSELMADHDFTLPADAYEEIVAALAAQPAQDYKESKDCKVSAARDHVLRANSAGLAIDAMDLDDPLGGWFDANTLEPTRNGEFLWDRFLYRVHPSPAQPAPVVDYTDIANRAQELTGRSIFPSTVEAVLKVAAQPAPVDATAEKIKALSERWKSRVIDGEPVPEGQRIQLLGCAAMLDSIIEAAQPASDRLDTVAVALRDALAYVGQRTDGTPAELAERAALWMRESQCLLRNPTPKRPDDRLAQLEDQAEKARALVRADRLLDQCNAALDRAANPCDEAWAVTQLELHRTRDLAMNRRAAALDELAAIYKDTSHD